MFSRHIVATLVVNPENWLRLKISVYIYIFMYIYIMQTKYLYIYICIYTISGWWYTYPSEKWWSSSVGMMTFPTEWKVIKFMFQTTNQNVISMISLDFCWNWMGFFVEVATRWTKWFCGRCTIYTIFSGSWYTYPSEKYEFVSIHNCMDSHKIPWFQSPPTTMWGPLVISWFISPSNYSYKYHKP